MKRNAGGSLLETVLFMPILLLLLLGMIELGRVAYTYYTLQKTLYSVARYLSVQQGVNFCTDGDTLIEQAKALALTGSTDTSAESYIGGLTADQIVVRIERYTAQTGDLGSCDCAAPGCDTASGGGNPDFIVVSLADGFPITLRIPGLLLDPISLRPHVRMPFQGT